MAKILKLPTAGLHKKVFEEDLSDVDFGSLATVFMDELYGDFANLVRLKLVNMKVAPTETSLKLFCEEVDELMGDMTISELIKETFRQNKKALLEDVYSKKP